MKTQYCLCNKQRVLLGPIDYDRNRFAAALAHHGGSVDDLPEEPPVTALNVLYLTLLPVVDTIQSPQEHDTFYHRAQPVLTVTEHHVGRKVVRTLYPLNYCTSQVRESIAVSTESALGLLEQGYTEREIKSWPQQRAEAAEYTADNSVDVPLLKGMAERRGIPLATFVDHVQAKVKITADLTAIILGDAQAANDKIKALQALDEAESLPTDWFEQLTDIADNWRKDWPAQLNPNPTL